MSDANAAPVIPRAVLIGPPGAGKSSVAARLGALLSVSVRDTDADIVKRAGKPISDVFLDEGEEHFRELEVEAVAVALAEHDGVLALGGGAILAPITQARLADYAGRGGNVIFLDVSLTAAAPRVGLNAARPLLVGNPRKRWQELYEQRLPIYRAVSTVRVSTDNATPQEVAATILKEL